MSLPIIQPKSEISIISPELIEINYEVNRNGKIIYWLKKYGFSLIFSTYVIVLIYFIDFVKDWQFIIIVFHYVLVGLFKYFIKLPIHSVKKTTITPKYLQLSYHNSFSNINRPLDDLTYLDFEINIYEDGSTVAIQNVEIPLYDVADFPILVDGIVKMLDLEYLDTARLSDETEILTYKSKTTTKINFRSLLRVEKIIGKIKILDSKKIRAYLEIDTINQFYQFSKNGTITEEDNLDTIEKIQIKHCIKTFKKTNFILIDFQLKNGKMVNVLETKAREIKEELTTIRDAKLLFDTFVELNFAKVELETINLSK